VACRSEGQKGQSRNAQGCIMRSAPLPQSLAIRCRDLSGCVPARTQYRYLTGKSPTRVSRPLLPRPHQPTPSAPMAPQQHQSDALKESQVQLALQAIKQDVTISQRRAAAIYRVPRKTMSDRRTGRPSRADSTPKSRNLDNNEEKVIV
jgi:hypothetical protein